MITQPSAAKRCSLIGLLGVLLAVSPAGAAGAGPIAPEAAPLVQFGVSHLERSFAERSNNAAGAGGGGGGGGMGGNLGYDAVAALALAKAGYPSSQAYIGGVVARIDQRFSASEYRPTDNYAGGIYEAAVCAMLLANVDPINRKSQVRSIAIYLMSRQKANGSWDYDQRQAGDTSITQYALLGLWEASNIGLTIPPRVFDDAAGWLLSAQSSGGSWCYHRDEQAQLGPMVWPDTISMTAAGVGSLRICEQQLRSQREGRKGRSYSPLMTPIGTPSEPKNVYVIKSGLENIRGGAARGMNWLGDHLDYDWGKEKSPFYAMYGIERAATLSDKAAFGGHDWFQEGITYLRKKQDPKSGWSAEYGPVANTAFAVLFLTKSTEQSVAKARKALEAGSLLGGRGLPDDLSKVQIARGRVTVRPLNGAVEGMLEALEDQRNDNPEAAFLGLRERYETDGAKVLKPFRDRFLRLLKFDPSPVVREYAAWGLAHSADFDVAPALIDALRDADKNVVRTSRNGLLLLSRKVDGYGPNENANAEETQKAIEGWTKWYESLRKR